MANNCTKSAIIAWIALAITVVSTVGGTAYFLGRKFERAEGLESKQTLNQQNADLKTRLVSIERRVAPSSEKKYFDVRILQVAPSELRRLSAEYKSFANGRFFVNAPIRDPWQYREMDGLEVGKLGVFSSVFGSVAQEPALRHLLEGTRHVWQSPSAGEISYELGTGNSRIKVSGNLTATAVVQQVVRKSLKDNVSAVISVIASATNKESNAGKTSVVVPAEKPKADNAETPKADNAETPKVDNKESETTKEQIEQVTSRLADIYDSTAAGFVLFDQLAGAVLFSIHDPSVILKIHSIQQQLNVFYLDVEYLIPNVTVTRSSSNCVQGSTITLSVRREMFFFSNKDGGYLIGVEVPSCDQGRSSVFEWISQWLAGLRIVVQPDL